MATVTFDSARWEVFCQLFNTFSFGTTHKLLETFLVRLVEFWPARAGMLLYISPEGTRTLCESGSLSHAERAVVEQARETFAREIDAQQDLGIYGVDGQERVIELPLRNGDEVVGLLHLVVEHDSGTAADSGELALMMIKMLGYRADNFSLIQRANQDLADAALISRTSRAITSNLDLRSLLRTIIEQVSQALDAEGGSLLLVDHARQELYFEMPTGERQEELKSYRMPMDQGIAGWVVTNGEPLIVNDAQSDPRLYRQVDQDIAFQTRSLLCAPMKSHDRMIGVIQAVNKRVGEFTQRDLNLLLTLANQAAIAVENAQLYQNLKEERDRLIHKEEEVRHRINRDLHDGPAQAVAAISMNIEFIKKLLRAMPEKIEEELDVLGSLVKKTNHDIRTLLFELRPLGLETQGLVSTLEQYVDRFRDPSGLQLHFEPGGFERRLPYDVEAVIFIIIQEAVNNARKHAGTQDIRISLCEEHAMLVARVCDKGQGFDLRAVEGSYDQRGSFGLLNMRERAQLIGGECLLRSAPGEGTVVEVRVPIASAEPELVQE